MIKIITCIFVIDLILRIYTFRFQRTTLGISRRARPNADKRKHAQLQAVMSPMWVGRLVFLSHLTGLALIILTGLYVNWFLAIPCLLYIFLIPGLLDIISPWPTYRHCLSLIKKQLKKEEIFGIDYISGNPRDAELVSYILRLPRYIEEIESEDPKNYKRIF
jgi:hypothetical protein